LGRILGRRDLDAQRLGEDPVVHALAGQDAER
jgi:hypothetical protein